MFLIVIPCLILSSRALLFFIFFWKERLRRADEGVVCLPDPALLAPGEILFHYQPPLGGLSCISLYQMLFVFVSLAACPSHPG